MRLRFLVVRTVAFTLAFLLTLPAPSFALRTEAGLESDPVRVGLEESLREETPAAPPQASVFSWPVADLNLSVRARKGLLMLGVQTVGELVQLIEEDLTGVRNFGAISREQIKERLTEQGLSLREKGKDVTVPGVTRTTLDFAQATAKIMERAQAGLVKRVYSKVPRFRFLGPGFYAGPPLSQDDVSLVVSQTSRDGKVDLLISGDKVIILTPAAGMEEERVQEGTVLGLERQGIELSERGARVSPSGFAEAQSNSAPTPKRFQFQTTPPVASFPLSSSPLSLTVQDQGAKNAQRKEEPPQPERQQTERFSAEEGPDDQRRPRDGGHVRQDRGAPLTLFIGQLQHPAFLTPKSTTAGGGEQVLPAAGMEEPTDAEMERVIRELIQGSDQARDRALETIRKWVGRPDGLPELTAIPSSQVDASTLRVAGSYAEDLRRHFRAFLQAAERWGRFLTVASRMKDWLEQEQWSLLAPLHGLASDWGRWGSELFSYAEAWTQWISRFGDSLEALASQQVDGTLGETRLAEKVASWRDAMGELHAFASEMSQIGDKLRLVDQWFEAIEREPVSRQPAPADGDDPFLKVLDAGGGRIPVSGLMYVNSKGLQDVLPDEIAGHRAIQPDVPRDLLDLRSAPIASGVRIFDRVGLPREAIPPGVEVVPLRELNRESLAEIRNGDVLFVDAEVDLEALLGILPAGIRPALIRIAASEAARLSISGVEALVREAERRHGRFLDVGGVASYKGREIAILGRAA